MFSANDYSFLIIFPGRGSTGNWNHENVPLGSQGAHPLIPQLPQVRDPDSGALQMKGFDRWAMALLPA